MLHETLDRRQTGMGDIAQPFRDLALLVERQTLFGTPCEEMQVRAHGPEEFLALSEGAKLALREQARLHKVFGFAHLIDVF